MAITHTSRAGKTHSCGQSKASVCAGTLLLRGSVDDWIAIAPPRFDQKAGGKFLKQPGRDSFFELF